MQKQQRDYEVILIAHPDLNAEALTQMQNQWGELVARHGGRVVESTLLGKRKLSYRIGRHHEGNYLQLKIQMPPSGVEGVRRSAALMESLIRILVMQGTGAPVPVLRADAPGIEPEA